MLRSPLVNSYIGTGARNRTLINGFGDRCSTIELHRCMERTPGLEPGLAAWKATEQPISHIRFVGAPTQN